MQNQDAGNLFHQNIVGFGSVLIEEICVDINVNELGWSLAGYPINAIVFGHFKVGPLGNGIHQHIDIARGKLIFIFV